MFGSRRRFVGCRVQRFSFHLSRQIQKSEVALDVANESLQKSERRFRSLMRDLSDVILVLASDGTLYYASHSAGRIFGYASPDLTGQNLSHCYTKTIACSFKNCLEKVGDARGRNLRHGISLAPKGRVLD